MVTAYVTGAFLADNACLVVMDIDPVSATQGSENSIQDLCIDQSGKGVSVGAPGRSPALWRVAPSRVFVPACGDTGPEYSGIAPTESLRSVQWFPPCTHLCGVLNVGWQNLAEGVYTSLKMLSDNYVCYGPLGNVTTHCIAPIYGTYWSQLVLLFVSKTSVHATHVCVI